MGIINALPDQYVPEATTSAAGLMSAADKTKLNGIENGAQANPGNASTSAAGLMSAEDKTKLNGIATGATAVEVVDSLSDTSTTKALSAGKGKELSDQITNANTSTVFSNLSYGNFNGLKFISGFFTGDGTSSIYLGLGNCSGTITTRNGATGALEIYYVSGGNISGYDGSTSRIFTNNVSYMISGVLKNS